ncbi:hypothetical protein ACKKBG_A20145 [Auxenochlorella protothecoides x Auxenochlorella symbiontica]|uniref:Toprim domain-containing protein n=1 Tax=Auxenochlorella protothecoides TaxID=3075 RepID=A0A1D1ZQE4_AUXPR
MHLSAPWCRASTTTQASRAPFQKPLFFPARATPTCVARRCRLVTRCTSPVSEGGIPEYERVVVVEGANDRRALLRAVQAKVIVLGSATVALSAIPSPTLAALRAAGNAATILTDPDVAGRQARNALEELLEEPWHAFLPVRHCTSLSATPCHEVGNVGVEHASPEALRLALAAARPSSPERTAFTRERLEALGLVASGIGPAAGARAEGSNSAATVRRRAALCDELGIGMCNGKQLLRQLNSYGFSMDDVVSVLNQLELGGVR